MDNQLNREACAWTPCCAGTIRELAQRLRATQRRRTIVRVGRVLAIVALLTTSAWAANGLLHYRDQQPVSLSCAEVRANLVAYRAGELPKAIGEKIATHLTTCTACRRLWQSLVPTNEVAFPMHVSQPDCRFAAGTWNRPDGRCSLSGVPDFIAFSVIYLSRTLPSGVPGGAGLAVIVANARSVADGSHRAPVYVGHIERVFADYHRCCPQPLTAPGSP